MQEPNEDAINNAITNRYLDAFYAEHDEECCCKCDKYTRRCWMTRCSRRECDSYICEYCHTDLQLALKVCSDSCGEKKIAEMAAELDGLRKPATSAPMRERPMPVRMVA